MSDSKLTFVLMAGLPGAGKSTLAAELERTLRWRHIDKDKQMKKLIDEGWDNEHASKEAYRLSFDEARTALDEQRTSVIFDSAALHRFILAEAEKIVDALDEVELKVVLCVASRVLRSRRLQTRLKQITTIGADPSTEEEYLQLYNHLPEEPGRLTLYTNFPLNECVAKVKDYVVSNDLRLFLPNKQAK